MKRRHQKLPFLPADALTKALFTESSVFFDIETTGLSPRHTQLYLIGCARRDGSSICLDQFFADSPAEEKEILGAFLELVRQCDTIITYNGNGFDIPYLKTKCEQLKLSEPFSDFTYIDIYKAISGLKHVLRLENYKQKTIERFLEITRNDKYTGGELIPVYQNYLKSPDETLLKMLLEHNYEDVVGMKNIAPILSYAHLFRGNLKSVTDQRLDAVRAYDGNVVKELTLTILPEYPLPKRVFFQMDHLYFFGDRGKVSLVIRLFEGELKHFFPNHKDYYYLPEEDCAIHKSVASFVDRRYRKQATAATCYTQKSGLFLPQYDSVMTPVFYQNYGDQLSYFPYTPKFAEDTAMLKCYAGHLLAVLGRGKPLTAH